VSDVEPSIDLTPKPFRPLLWPSELARVLRVSRGVLDHLVDTGQLKAVRVGPKRLFRPEDVEAFLRSCSE